MGTLWMLTGLWSPIDFGMNSFSSVFLSHNKVVSITPVHTVFAFRVLQWCVLLWELHVETLFLKINSEMGRNQSRNYQTKAACARLWLQCWKWAVCCSYSCTPIDLLPRAPELTLHQEALWQSRSDEDHPPPCASSDCPALDVPFVWCLMTAVMEPSCSVITPARSQAFFRLAPPLCSFPRLHLERAHLIAPDLSWHHLKSHFTDLVGFVKYAFVCIYIYVCIYVYEYAAISCRQGGPVAKNIL